MTPADIYNAGPWLNPIDDKTWVELVCKHYRLIETGKTMDIRASQDVITRGLEYLGFTPADRAKLKWERLRLLALSAAYLARLSVRSMSVRSTLPIMTMPTLRTGRR